MTYELDKLDVEIRDQRIAAREGKEGPRVGDFIEMEDERLMRFSHDWDDAGLQVSQDGRFYFEPEGDLNFSGSLDPIVPLAHIQETSRTLLGQCWFFHHDHAMKDNGVYTSVPCRVFREVRI